MNIFTYIFIFIMLFFGFVSCMDSPFPQQPIVDPKETERCLNGWKYALSSICNKDAEKYFETLHLYAYNHNTPMLFFLMKRENEKNKNLRKDLFEFCGKNITTVDDIYQCIDVYKSLKSDDFIIKTAKKNNLFFYKVALRCGARLNVCDSVTGHSLFGIAVQNKAAAIVFELLSNEALTIRLGDLITNFPFTFFQNKILLFEQLLARVEVNVQDDAGNSLLHYAVLYNFPQLVECLLKQDDIEVNSYNFSFNTPLHIAVEGNHAAIVAQLLNHKKINISKTNRHGHTACMIAKKRNYYDIVLLLQQHEI